MKKSSSEVQLFKETKIKKPFTVASKKKSSLRAHFNFQRKSELLVLENSLPQKEVEVLYKYPLYHIEDFIQ